MLPIPYKTIDCEIDVLLFYISYTYSINKITYKFYIIHVRILPTFNIVLGDKSQNDRKPLQSLSVASPAKAINVK